MYSINGTHAYMLEDELVPDGNSGWSVWVQEPPWIASVSPPPPLTWYSQDQDNWHSIDFYGTGFTDVPWLSGCDGGIDDSSWTVHDSTHISGWLHVSTALSQTCTVIVLEIDALALSVGLVPGAPPTPTLSCPQSITRGDTVTCTATGGSVTQWSFSGQSDDGKATFSITGPTAGLIWSGPMVASGTVSATVGGQTRTQTVTVTPRPAFASVPMPPVPVSPATNGSYGMDMLTSPPDPPPPTPEVNHNPVAESTYYGRFGPPAHQITIGPNQGLYYVTPFTDLSSYQWELNPGVTDPNDDFYQHQGVCFPTPAAVVAAAEAHEIGTATPSHYTEVRDFLAVTTNNPGYLAEPIVRTGADAVNQAISALYQAAVSAGSQEPPQGLPDNINYPPYRTCGQ